MRQEHRNQITILKEKVENSHNYWAKNATRYNDFFKFVFQTSLSNEDITKLQALNKPTLEFNVLESKISRLRGEFAKQEPGIKIRASDSVRIQDMTKEYLEMVHVLEGHLREILLSTTTDGLQYKIYTDLLGGGYSVVEVFTDYINEMSFDQKIHVNRVFDPTLTGFDPLARQSHKGDGAYCFQLFPKTREEFIDQYGSDAAEGMSFSRNVGRFNWSYNNQQTDIILLCNFFEKVINKIKIVKLSTGHTVTKKHYHELLKMWQEREFIQQAPIIIDERWTELETIERYTFCETQVLSHDETNFKFFPLIYIDGNSVDIKDSDNAASTQMTRPYAYQAMGVQKLLNFSGQTVAHEIETMVQHKFKVAIESIPNDYTEAYKNVQIADVLVYNAFLDKNPNQPLPPPMEIQRTPTPPIVETTFMGSNRILQEIMGSYDSTLGTNEKDVSGRALTAASIITNTASTPYLMGYIHGINRVCQVVLDLIPKYYVTPRSLPIMTMDGKRSYQIINNPQHPKNINVSYNPSDLQVEVEAGVNNEIQKQVALDQIIRMMQASPLFAQFINTVGLEIILDNLDIRNIETLKVMGVQFMQQMQKQQAEQAGKPTPEQEAAQGLIAVEQAKVQQRAQESEGKLAVEAARVAIEKQKVDAQVMEIINEIETKNAKLALDQEKVDSENARTAVETALEITKHHHEVRTSENEREQSE